jgi:Lon protease-like protein
MARSPFDPGFDELPRVLPVFPLTGVLLLPSGKLPLNIFEPRYLAMTRDALATDARLIGMVQPRVPDLDDNRGASTADLKGERPDVYSTGCAGRITEFAESDDGRYVMTLTGLYRFDLVEDMSDKDGYRRVLADYSKYRGDLGGAREAMVDRDRLLAAVKGYFAHQGISLDWESVKATPDERLVTSLAMTCPFGPNERQALLEAPGTTERADIVTTLLEMALAETGDASPSSH